MPAQSRNVDLACSQTYGRQYAAVSRAPLHSWLHFALLLLGGRYAVAETIILHNFARSCMTMYKYAYLAIIMQNYAQIT